MGIELGDLATAVHSAQAILREHRVETHEYLGLSDEAREYICNVVSAQIDLRGVPRSRRQYHAVIMKATEVGMILGMAIQRWKDFGGD